MTARKQNKNNDSPFFRTGKNIVQFIGTGFFFEVELECRHDFSGEVFLYDISERAHWFAENCYTILADCNNLKNLEQSLKTVYK